MDRTGGIATCISVGAPGLKGSRREAEAWHHVVSSQHLKGARERLWVKAKPRYSGGTGVLEMPGLWDDHKDNSSCGEELA